MRRNEIFGSLNPSNKDYRAKRNISQSQRRRIHTYFSNHPTISWLPFYVEANLVGETILRSLHYLKYLVGSRSPTATYDYYHGLHRTNNRSPAACCRTRQNPAQWLPTSRDQGMAHQTIGKGLRGRTVQLYPFATGSNRLNTRFAPSHLRARFIRHPEYSSVWSLWWSWRVGGFSRSLVAVATGSNDSRCGLDGIDGS